MPGVAIASRGPVRSVCLFHRGPLERVRRVALDTSSRTSAALVRVLLRERLGRDPQYVPMGPGLVDMLAVADAALLIGDPALDQEGEFAAPRPRRGVAAADRAAVRLRVLGRPGRLRSRPAGRAPPADGPRWPAWRTSTRSPRGRRAACRARAERYRAYLRENIVFELGEAEQAGLREFYRRAHALSLIPAVPELRFHAQD